MHSKKLRANLFLLLAAFIWGMAFVAQSKGMESCGPFLFNGVRSILGALVLLPLIAVLDKKEKKEKGNTSWPIFGGISCGVVLFLASSFQQMGLLETGPGKAGFITALYVVLVPVFSLFLGKKMTAVTWISVAIALFGMYLLCMNGELLTLAKSDLLVLLCAVLFTGHIMVIDHFAPHVDCVRMASLQFFVSGILSLLAALCTEDIQITYILDAALPIAYTGILSSGVAYTLQVVAQKDTDPASAALICSLESVFALLGGVVLMGEVFSGRELWGCLLTFGAIMLSQLPEFKKRKV